MTEYFYFFLSILNEMQTESRRDLEAVIKRITKRRFARSLVNTDDRGRSTNENGNDGNKHAGLQSNIIRMLADVLNTIQRTGERRKRDCDSL